MEDAERIIRILHRDFHWCATTKGLGEFTPYSPSSSAIPLKDKIYRVGNIENAVKAIILYNMAENYDKFSCLSLPKNYDFANEFFIVQTTRKAVDILCIGESFYKIIEVKTDLCDEDTLSQALYYRDLLRQRSWVDLKDRIDVSLLGKRFSNEAMKSCSLLNKPFEFIKLIKYIPIETSK